METGNKFSGSMNRISIKITKLISLSIMLIMLTGTSTTVSADIVWFEDFDDFDDNSFEGLELYGWDTTTEYYVEIDHGFSIVDGALKAPSSESFDIASYMLINSSVAYGTWSFDLILSESDSSQLVVEYMQTAPDGKYNRTGDPNVLNLQGYCMIFVSDGNAYFSYPGIYLSVLKGTEFEIIVRHHLPKTDLTGTHHIDVTRDLTGLTKVYLDFKQQFNFTDTRWNSSEKFGMMAWVGGPAIDNIRVSNTVDEIKAPASSPSDSSTSQTSATDINTSTDTKSDDSPIPLWVWIGPLFVIVIFRRTQKAKNK